MIELLVVVSIIVLLLSLLAPALDRAVNEAENAKCLSNLHAMGRNLAQYLQDNNRIYPPITNWSTLIGKNGTLNTYGESNPGSWGAFGTYPSAPRIMNEYMGYDKLGNGEVPIAECPLDVGDSEPGHPAKANCYTQYGTSYLPAYGGNWFRVKTVFGQMNNAGLPSARQSSFKRTSNKLLLADWFWHANRFWMYEKTRWHATYTNDKLEDDPNHLRQVNTLWADSSAGRWQPRVGDIEDRYTSQATPPDPQWYWW